MIRCAIFDLDGTLARVGEPAKKRDVELLCALRKKGVLLALSSGKPTFYQCGFARQMGLSDAYLIGENGGVLQQGVALPPPICFRRAIPPETRKALSDLRVLLEERFPGRLWFQPNELSLTPFLYHEEDFAPLRALLSSYIRPEMHLMWYEHPDCFDIEYDRLDKGAGVDLLSEATGILPRDMVSVGDWTNDYAMFAKTGLSVGIRLPDPTKADHIVPDLTAALNLILQNV